LHQSLSPTNASINTIDFSTAASAYSFTVRKSNGGIVNSTAFTAVGDEADHSSRIVVTGAGSVLNAFNLLQIGDTSCGCNLVGTLTIEDGGVVNSPGTTSIGQGSTLNLGTPLNFGPLAWLARSTPRRSPTTGRSSPTSPTLRPSVPTSPAPA